MAGVGWPCGVGVVDGMPRMGLWLWCGVGVGCPIRYKHIGSLMHKSHCFQVAIAISRFLQVLQSKRYDPSASSPMCNDCCSHGKSLTPIVRASCGIHRVPNGVVIG